MTQNANYYKGVLLCTRPNENLVNTKQKPFCGRVYPKQQLGIVPNKNYVQHEITKRKLPILSHHKKWLEKLKNKVQDKKNQEDNIEKKKKENIEKVKLEGQIQRNKLKKSGQYTFPQAYEHVGGDKKIVEKQHHTQKKKKPMWAKTQKQIEDGQDQEVDKLLNFFQGGEIQNYLSDEQIKVMLNDLKVRIATLKQDGDNWRQKEINRKNQKQRKIVQERQNNNNDQNDDILSRISKQSEIKSKASEKTSQRVQELKRKKEQKSWQQVSKSSKKTTVSVDEQIAKNVADQILRNYPSLKHHSNQSIRKLLEKHAQDEIKQ